MKKTKTEIDTEITALQALKSRVPRKTFFGDDNWAGIDAQIEVLRCGLVEDDLMERCGDGLGDGEWPEDWREHTHNMAFDACQWRDGETDDKPSEAWD